MWILMDGFMRRWRFTVPQTSGWEADPLQRTAGSQGKVAPINMPTFPLLLSSLRHQGLKLEILKLEILSPTAIVPMIVQALTRCCNQLSYGRLASNVIQVHIQCMWRMSCNTATFNLSSDKCNCRQIRAFAWQTSTSVKLLLKCLFDGSCFLNLYGFFFLNSCLSRAWQTFTR